MSFFQGYANVLLLFYCSKLIYLMELDIKPERAGEDLEKKFREIILGTSTTACCGSQHF